MKTFFALAAFASIAASATASVPRTGSWKIGNDGYHIYYADLDMNSANGRAQLLARVEKGAARLCEDLTSAEERRCMNEIVARSANPDIRRALADRTDVQLARR
ncbi:MAG TPA: UrcA family protein [Sphingomonas sp.]|nr:UrcA family protein [Sphingomonas sp.]